MSVLNMQLNYKSKVFINQEDEQLPNKSFQKGIIWVAYAGKNRNRSHISKETFENCIDSIKNIPIVCHYLREEQDFGGHDVEIFRDEETGNLNMVHATHPIGVIPSDAKHWWEVIYDNGVEREYLCVEALLWKREEGFTKLESSQTVSESMEIAINSGEVIDGVYYIYDFEFTALCLLGSGVEPCYEGASLQLFNLEDLNKELSQMLEDYKAEFSDVDINTFDKQAEKVRITKGGSNYMDENFVKVFEKYGFDSNETKLDIEYMSLEEVDSKLKEMKCSLNSQIMSSLEKALDSHTYVAEWCGESHETRRYVFFDYDAEISEAYYYDRKDDCNIYGFKYSFDGDVATVDIESATKKKCILVDFVEGETSQSFNLMQDIRQEFNQIYSKATAEIESLSDFKDSVLKEKRDMEINQIFEKFSILEGCEAFSQLKLNTKGMSIEEIEDKCYAIKGRTELTFSKTKETTPTKLGVDPNVATPPTKTKEVDEPYGGLFRKYGVIKED